MIKIGLLGGSFDPIHNRHIELAQRAKQQFGLDEVLFVLSANTPLKTRKLSSYSKRKHMLLLALSPKRKFKGCFIEQTSKDENFTIDTIKKLKKIQPASYYFILGEDQVEQLQLWKDIDTLQHMVKLCAASRYKQQWSTPYKVETINFEPKEISSTQIRLGASKDVNAKVYMYMMKECLYPDMLKTWMSEKRYLHTCSVAKVCVDLARHHGLNQHTAYISAMYHDLNKEFKYLSLEQSKNILAAMNPAILKQDMGIWHGYLGAYICSHYFNVRDKKALQAIEHHVLGDHASKYTKILYLADKLEPTRSHVTRDRLKFAFQDLDACFILEKQKVKEYHEGEFHER